MRVGGRGAVDWVGLFVMLVMLVVVVVLGG
jgi:hypothetical protein